MEVVLLGTLALTVKQFVDWLKYVVAGQWIEARTQLVAWVGGIVLVFLAANASMFQTIDINGVALGKLNWAALVLLGANIGSTGSFLHDFVTPSSDPPKLATRRELRKQTAKRSAQAA